MEKKFIVDIAFKNSYGGSRIKTYTFNDKRHYENWMRKVGSRYDIEDIYFKDTDNSPKQN